MAKLDSPHAHAAYLMTLKMIQSFYAEINNVIDKEYINEKIIKYVGQFLREWNITVTQFMDGLMQFYERHDCVFDSYDQVLYYKFYIELEMMPTLILQKYCQTYGHPKFKGKRIIDK